MEKIFTTTKLFERLWTKLVTLDTLHWYCDGPKPTTVARHYDIEIRQCKSVPQNLDFLSCFSSYLTLFYFCVEMEESRRRAYIKQQVATKKKQEGSLPPKATGQANPLTKWKPSEKVDRPPKKPKVVMGPNFDETPTKLPSKPGLGIRKGLMKGADPVAEKCPVLLHEDSRYALKQLSSIIKDDDYEDLGNYAIEAIGEMGLFSLVQVCLTYSFLLRFVQPLSHSNFRF